MPKRRRRTKAQMEALRNLTTPPTPTPKATTPPPQPTMTKLRAALKEMVGEEMVNREVERLIGVVTREVSNIAPGAISAVPKDKMQKAREARAAKRAEAAASTPAAS